MAGFETIVRPVIFPNIRPAPSRSLAPADDPDKGICEINFRSSHPVSLSRSGSISVSYSKPSETQRQVDEVRVYQKEDDGTINRDNFVDVETPTKIWMDVGTRGQADTECIPQSEIWKFRRPEAKDNIEIREQDKIIVNDTMVK